MLKPGSKSLQVFKTASFAKSARRAGISDLDLCKAITEVIGGQFAADLGGGVYKKRLKKNMYRSIILAKCGKRWVYEYLFAKNERDNISDDELQGYKFLARSYSKLTTMQLDQLMSTSKLLEICNGSEEK